jgi:hypothetical protein
MLLLGTFLEFVRGGCGRIPGEIRGVVLRIDTSHTSDSNLTEHESGGYAEKTYRQDWLSQLTTPANP